MLDAGRALMQVSPIVGSVIRTLVVRLEARLVALGLAASRA